MRNETIESTQNPPHSSTLIPHSSLGRREWAWAVLGCALAATLFLSPALFTGRWLSPADVLYSFQPWRAEQPPGWPGDSNGLLI